jgi:hypothetical protein
VTLAVDPTGMVTVIVYDPAAVGFNTVVVVRADLGLGLPPHTASTYNLEKWSHAFSTPNSV